MMLGRLVTIIIIVVDENRDFVLCDCSGYVVENYMFPDNVQR
jgi:hypothetical protein